MQYRSWSTRLSLPSGDEPGERPPLIADRLDGITIMRYAHIYRDRTSGGVEQYLGHLNRRLLERHRMTLVQMHLVPDEGRDAPIETEAVALGRILWVPVGVRHPALRHTVRRYLPQTLSQLPTSIAYGLAHLRSRTPVFSDRLASLLHTFQVDLLTLHWATLDSGPLVRAAERSGIPFIYVHHFDNARLATKSTPSWIRRAAAIGCVSEHGVPPSLHAKYVELSDGIDVDFFAPEKASHLVASEPPLVLLPGRIAAGKGHADLIAAVRILIQQGVRLVVAFAGDVDSEGLHQELRASIDEAGLAEGVRFLGQVSPTVLRDWYAASSIVVLPSYSEGLPRVLLEAQAMKKPIVTYECGGIPEAVLRNETAIVLDKGDVRGLAENIHALLEDPARRSRMGEAGRKFVATRFSIAALIERHEALYLKLLSPADKDRSS
jgi:glycosyltransferase involved in cell wall biosynthesis